MTPPLLPVVPAISQLRFRTYRDEADIPAIAGLLAASYSANGDTVHVDPEELRVETRHLTNVDPRQDMVLGLVGERLVARSLLTWADTPDGSARYYQSWGDVHPDWRRRGIGTAMWRRNIERLRAIAAGQTFAGERLLTVPWLRHGDVGGAVLARRFGYERVRVYHHMTRPTLDDVEIPPLPDGLEVRPVTRADLPAIWDAIIEAFRDHFGAFDTSQESYRAWIESPSTDPSLMIIAFDGDEVAGGIHNVIDPAENEAQGYLRGWTDPVYVRRRWRRRGLAAALMGRALLRLREEGMTSAQLDVDAENPHDALTLYERHGFVSDRSATEWHRPLADAMPRSRDAARDRAGGQAADD
ncbi:MAG: GNAT family N-acetyltransferase [Chloroflexota bacterium]